ncbi:hypothetical protein KC222_14875 [Cedecea davisae]|uniref:Uncharacterized protein n=1 Tax=Cedecea davisae TaxID=158484 RepID=A0ABS6DKR5_9ENTR|nr:hypothetical protein [Cedecea davisae]MBU4683295.1 hypothetical protein [Cedecea davisae]MBU4686759.1 hypothetical protein [Cedecea davisae]
MNNNDHPKIAFAYPTFLKVGMIATGPFVPDIGWQIKDFPAKISFYVSAGLILNSKRQYSFDVDVIFDNNSQVEDNVPPVDSKLIGTAVSDEDDFVALSTTFLQNVNLPSEGLYTVRVLLYAGVVGDNERLLIDQCDCHFVIAKNWLPNEMKRTA